MKLLRKLFAVLLTLCLLTPGFTSLASSNQQYEATVWNKFGKYSVTNSHFNKDDFIIDGKRAKISNVTYSLKNSDPKFIHLFELEDLAIEGKGTKLKFDITKIDGTTIYVKKGVNFKNKISGNKITASHRTLDGKLVVDGKAYKIPLEVRSGRYYVDTIVFAKAMGFYVSDGVNKKPELNRTLVIFLNSKKVDNKTLRQQYVALRDKERKAEEAKAEKERKEREKAREAEKEKEEKSKLDSAKKSDIYQPSLKDLKKEIAKKPYTVIYLYNPKDFIDHGSNDYIKEAERFAQYLNSQKKYNVQIIGLAYNPEGLNHKDINKLFDKNKSLWKNYGINFDVLKELRRMTGKNLFANRYEFYHMYVVDKNFKLVGQGIDSYRKEVHKLYLNKNRNIGKGDEFEAVNNITLSKFLDYTIGKQKVKTSDLNVNNLKNKVTVSNSAKPNQPKAK